jgi:hypothetical protein
MRLMGNSVLGLAAAVLIGGCMTAPPLDYETTVQEWQSALERTAACVKNVKQSGIYQRLSERLVLFPGDDERLEQKLRIEDLPTQQELFDMAAWPPLIQPCRDIRLESARRIYPKLAWVLEDAQAEMDMLYSQLFSGLLDLGQFNNQMVRQNEAVTAQLKQVQEEMNRGFQDADVPFVPKL